MPEPKIIYSKDLPDIWHEEIAAGESLNWLLIFQDKVPREVNLKFLLSERRSKGEIMLVYLGKEKNETAMNIVLVHEAPETYGRIMVKAALFDEAKFTLKGLLKIGENAKGADSYLSAKSLLMSPQARAEIHPHLEIKNNEVKASHGSSLGRLDENQLFYLQSRGLELESAQNMILAGFFGEHAYRVFPPSCIKPSSPLGEGGLIHNRL
ncbi:MAG: SufD family Fe-S cluster assembly protein [Candidatus Sungbacteria bacterium]|nr:SufD family Fe-S cluster assembly protein [Candidatus Sungbacteria bacterium]